ncbi:MAG TPA: acyltransferase [Hyphomicrobiaceae bacterium]|nr:acyltransferase [Hyphomicrobiaceae bacterium]
MASTIAALLHGRDNNFNLIRFLAASAVLLDHSFALVAHDQTASALIDVERLEIGRLAVDVFFILSGFLVTRSVMTQPTLIDYAVARFLRLFPALLVACIGIAFVLGPIVTSAALADYFTDPRPWLFVPLTTSLITHSMTLPGVFEHVPESGVIDPPLWTLRYETMCYVLLALFALFGALATRFRATLTLAVVLGAYAFITFATSWRGDSSAIDSAARFVLDFFLGGAFYVFADKIRVDLRVALVLGLAAAATFGTAAHEAVFRVALTYGLLWFALVPAGAIRRFNLIGDYSYGIYILCFPIQQTFVMLNPQITPGWLFMCSFPAVLALAILSWHFIEHPALRRKAWAGDCVGSLMRGAQQRLTTFLGLGAAPKPQASASER